MRVSKEMEAKILALEAPRQVPKRPPEAQRRRQSFVIRDWHPARLNKLINCHHMQAHRLKQADKAVVDEAVRLNGITRATKRRRVTLMVVLKPGQRGGDPDCYWKSLLDALVACGVLVNDSSTWCELASVEYMRGQQSMSVITLEEVEDE